MDWLRSFIRFAVVGVLNVIVDFLVYWSLTRNFNWWQEHFLIANAAAFLVANINSFLWNRQWTFKASQVSMFKQYGYFFVTSAVYLLILQTGLWSLVKFAHWPDLLAKLVTVAIAASGYFSFLKLVIFKPNHTPSAVPAPILE